MFLIIRKLFLFYMLPILALYVTDTKVTDEYVLFVLYLFTHVNVISLGIDRPICFLSILVNGNFVLKFAFKERNSRKFKNNN